MDDRASLTSRIATLLRNRHRGPGWAFFAELRTKCGFAGRQGYIDAFAVGCWADDRSCIAYEIKSDRSDFLHDVNSFMVKQEVALRNSNQFYYAAPHGMVKPEEVPEVAGLMTMDAGGLKVRKVAQHRELAGGAMSMDFTRSLLRAAAGEAKRAHLWKYADRESLTEDDVLRIAKDHVDRATDGEIQRRAREMAKTDGEEAHKALVRLYSTVGLPYDARDPLVVNNVDRLIERVKGNLRAEFLVKAMVDGARDLRRSIEEFERMSADRNGGAVGAV